ncbi:FecR protein [Planctomycetes bacterium K2D]|uniref:FecR protein n=2 Tax=Botrimarina mediterranea TaxID=2528022 RepID=A0A518K2E0_9BACT|nr:FecR protein [Botrimarina mediterranea]QDV76483.1 FecR protein [Planctomycetes bacterium K2D]
MQEDAKQPVPSSTNADTPKLRRLLASVVLGDASSDDWQALNDLLLQDSGAREYASRYFEEEASLRREFALYDKVANFNLPGEDAAIAGRALPKEVSRVAKRWRAFAGASLAVAAALAAIVATYFDGVSDPAASVPSAGVARVVVGAIDSAVGDTPGNTDIRPIHIGDRIATEEGLASLRFDCGAEVVLKGPAEIEVVSPMRARLIRGTLTAQVQESAHGFRIDTPNSRVIDLGTEFGLSVDDEGDTEMVVFTGKVALQYAAALPIDIGAPAPNVPLSNLELLGDGRLLTDGEAMGISRSGEVRRLMMVRDTDFPRSFAPIRQPSPTGRVLERVWDNIRDRDTAKCYRVSEGGFGEDAQAFVDRHYQWNGIQKEHGLPQFLRGADYVLPYCDDKVDENLKVTVRLAQAARLYVLLDNRLEIPAWLKAEYQDSGYDVAIDEDNFSNERSWQHLGVGPGELLDRTCSVWFRDVLAPGDVVLGGIKPPSDWSVMYGVVAKPLNDASRAAAEPASHHQATIGRGLVHTGVLPRPIASAAWERVESFDKVTLAPPSAEDAASSSKGRRMIAHSPGGQWLPHPNVTVLKAGVVPALNDGLLSRNNDDLERNAWFNNQGRFTLDLLQPTLIRQINGFSWHRWGRSLQHFTVWGSNAETLPPIDFETSDEARDWEFIGLVDSRFGDPGGVHASQLTTSTGSMGPFRHLLWIVERSEQSTFFAEVDVHASIRDRD